MLKIEVNRHDQEEQYFDPWIEEHDGGGVTVHVHWDDISEYGARLLAELLANQVRVRRWRPRPPGAPRGRRIPVAMERRTVMDEGAAVAVDDRPEAIVYTMRADLITRRGAAGITRAQSERTPHWERVPACASGARHSA